MENYEFLGILETDTIKHAEMKEKKTTTTTTKRQYMRRTTIILETKVHCGNLTKDTGDHS